jgi:hypothetical protein
MLANRRMFLKTAGGLWLLRGARQAICDGSLGRVVFCRASIKTAAWLPLVLDGPAPVCERIERDELVLCGTEATLVLDESGYRRFA